MTRIVQPWGACQHFPGSTGAGWATVPRTTDRAAWDGEYRRRAGRGHRDTSLSRPGECCAERSPGFLHADLIGREGTRGEQARRRGVLLPENPTLRGRS
jgi:hypothetical protein